MIDGLNNLLTSFGDFISGLPSFFKFLAVLAFSLLGFCLVAWVVLSFGSLSVFMSVISSALLLIGIFLVWFAGCHTAFLSPKYTIGVGLGLLVVALLLQLPWGDLLAPGFATPVQGAPALGSSSNLMPTLVFGAKRHDFSRTGLSVLDLWVPSWILLNAVLIHKIALGKKKTISLFSGNLVWLALLVATSLTVARF